MCCSKAMIRHNISHYLFYVVSVITTCSTKMRKRDDGFAFKRKMGEIEENRNKGALELLLKKIYDSSN